MLPKVPLGKHALKSASRLACFQGITQKSDPLILLAHNVMLNLPHTRVVSPVVFMWRVVQGMKLSGQFGGLIGNESASQSHHLPRLPMPVPCSPVRAYYWGVFSPAMPAYWLRP